MIIMKPERTGARRIVVEFVGVRIGADDAERVAAVLANPSGHVRIHREAPSPALIFALLHRFFSLFTEARFSIIYFI